MLFNIKQRTQKSDTCMGLNVRCFTQPPIVNNFDSGRAVGGSVALKVYPKSQQIWEFYFVFTTNCNATHISFTLLKTTIQILPLIVNVAEKLVGKKCKVCS